MDAETKKLLKAYRWETDEELDRKRKVYLSFIVGQIQDEIRAKSMDLEANREMHEALSKIVRGRERRRRVWGEVYRWAGVLVPFVRRPSWWCRRRSEVDPLQTFSGRHWLGGEPSSIQAL